MSAAPRYDPSIGIAGLLMSADEYLAIGEIPERTELIHGVVVMSPSSLPRHQKIILELLRQLGNFACEHPGVEVFPETDVKVDNSLVYRPDVVAYQPGRLAADPERLDVAPDLVVEVLSPGSKALDLITKRQDYERHGIREYWIIDPKDGSVRVWRRQGARLVEVAESGDRLVSSSIAGFILDTTRIRSLARNT